jgi:O-antigen ligase
LFFGDFLVNIVALGMDNRFGWLVFDVIAFCRSLNGQWPLLVVVAFWSGVLLYHTFRRKDWLLVVLLFAVVLTSLRDALGSGQITDATLFLLGVSFGRGICLLVFNQNNPANDHDNVRAVSWVMACLVWLLAASTLWEFTTFNHFSFAVRWSGFWQNPNIFGMLIGTGLVLGMALLLTSCEGPDGKVRPRVGYLTFLVFALCLLATALVFSFSRGAWFSTLCGMLYLCRSAGRSSWRFVLLILLCGLAVAGSFWRSTGDDDPLYLKRLDFSRPSVGHRVAAWQGAVFMMRDHPLGVGWGKAIDVYEKSYSAPGKGSRAIETNSYLMFGAEAGVLSVLSLAIYVLLCLRSAGDVPAGSMACRAGAMVLLISFWFDGGLFRLPTASIFWLLLELGAGRKRTTRQTEWPLEHRCL